MSSLNPQNNQAGSYFDDWAEHKDDLVWRRFWALWELRRKWNWANWFYQRVDRTGDEVVETKCWTITPGPGYMKLCLWIALLRSVHEGITHNLDSYDTLQGDRMHPNQVLPPLPEIIQDFPAIPGSPFRDFRNAIFHCQWSPTLSKFKLDDSTTKRIEELHQEIGDWLTSQFRISYKEFDSKYRVPPYVVYDPNGDEWMPELFF